MFEKYKRLHSSRSGLNYDFSLKDLLKIVYKPPKGSRIPENCNFSKVWKTDRSIIPDYNKSRYAKKFSSTVFMLFMRLVLEDIVKNDSEFAIFDRSFKLKMLAVSDGLKTATMRLEVKNYGYDIQIKKSNLESKNLKTFSLRDFKIYFPADLRAWANQNVDRYSNVYYVVNKDDS